MLLKKITPVFFCFFVFACASVSRLESQADKIYAKPHEAIINVTPIATLSYDNFINIKIEDKSPSILNGSENNKFEIISVKGLKNQPFLFSISSICDCLGFRKHTPYIISSIYDSNAKIISEEKIITPKNKKISGIFPADGIYKIILIADSSNKGKKIGDAVGYMPNGGAFTVSETVYPTGLVSVRWNKALQ